MDYWWWGLVFLTGACVGSFLNVCICRIPQGESVIFPPSRCPSCLHALQPVDLLPIISYIALKRKCRYCECEIPLQYPVVELLTGILFVLAVSKYGVTLGAFRAVLLFAVIIPATIIDLKNKIIPNKLNMAGLVLGIPFIFGSKEIFLSSAIGFTAGGGLLLLIAVLSRGGMGGGDVKLAAVMGLLLGWKHLLVALFLAFAFGGAVGIVMLLLNMRKMKDAVPFGPSLGFGAVIAALAGDGIITWYLKFSGWHIM